MKIKIFAKYRLVLLVMLCSLTSSTVFAQGNNYRVMEVVEVAFNSQQRYNNAYMDVDVWVELKKSGSANEVYRIPIFWDGGDVFRARLVATSPGKWNWNIINKTVENSDKGFIGKSGSFNATAADVSSNPNNRGFISVDPKTNRTLQYADGTPFFYTADTSWSALTAVFGFEKANSISGISFKDYILARKKQGFNGLNVIASFPDDTYLQQKGRNLDRPRTESGLWSSDTWGKKTGPNGETPFALKRRGQPVTDALTEVDYKRINPEYWQSVDERMQFLSDQGFVTLFESVRRHERWPFRAQEEKDAFYNYIRYLWARYGCYNMIFSWVHHDFQKSIYPKWLELVRHAHDELRAKMEDNRMPYGQPRTAMSFDTSLENWEKDIPGALDIQNVSNARRDETMHKWLQDIYRSRKSTKPALNLEPFYPGWGYHSSNEVNAGLDDTTMAQMQMYGSVLSGGLAGHAWGDAWYAGAAASTRRSQKDGGTIVAVNDPQVNALKRFDSQSMGHLKNFVLDAGHEYQRLIPAADTNLSDSQNLVHTLSISDDKAFALGFFTADSRRRPAPLPVLTNLTASKSYLFEWWDVSEGGWICEGTIKTTGNGRLQPPALPNNDRTKSWAYRIRSEDYLKKRGNLTESDCGIPKEKEEDQAFVLRINSGGGNVRYEGDAFSADTYSDTGSTSNGAQTGLDDPFKSFRYSKSQVMGYDIPLNNGKYTVRLHFAELWFGVTGGGSGGKGSRVFDVSMEDDLVENNLDVFAQVGAETVLTKSYNVSVTDGKLNIDFSSLDADGGTRHPIINAIEVLGIEDSKPPVVDRNPPSKEGLVGHWRLDDSSGVRATDASGERHNGTLTGGFNFSRNSVDGEVLNALDFSGIDDYITLPNIDKSVENRFTIAAWIKPERTTGDYQGIAGTNTSRGFMTFVHNGSLAFSLHTDRGRRLLRHGKIIANRWQHIAVSYDGGTMTWFIDGNEVGSARHTGQVLDRNVGYIGWSGWGKEYFEGGIDDVQLFNNALTEQQVANLFEEGKVKTALVKLSAKIGTTAEGTENLTAEKGQLGYVYPNPTEGSFRITGLSSGTKQIIVNDFAGRVLITFETDQEEPELNLSRYPNGIYTVNVLQNESALTLKVIKE